ncbi:hypothetical protein K1W69_15690 [Hoeflea sp. WL0058]|uniref:Uncharacterized protein n=1 Tax=Flavimaribacter sediminis TaxID=2865987 RepID=A0AAE2ZQI5_9HYPH|nr:hypothetical protein [Flavimaribacter sediminis]MBW8638638.1 hypothetical protein [Flavimaribacter sediminis]
MPEHDENISEANKKLRNGEKTGEKAKNGKSIPSGGKGAADKSSGEDD